MPYTPTAVVAYSFSFPDFTFTMNLNGTVARTDVGKAVSRHTTANTAKLAADGEHIIGRLDSVELGGQDGLTVGAVARKFRGRLPIKTGLTGVNAVAIGDTVVGAGGGEVRALNNGTAKTPNPAFNTVIDIDQGFAIVEFL